MKRATHALAALALASTAALLPAAAAQAGDGQPRHHHVTAAEKAQRAADRKAERREQRSEARATPTATSTAAATQVTPAATATIAPTKSTTSTASCAVAIDRSTDGVHWPSSNTCDQPVDVILSVQHQPGPWHVGICQQGGCSLAYRTTVSVPVGEHVLTIDLPDCPVQVDWKDQTGKLLKSGHYHQDGCSTPTTSTSTTSTTSSSTSTTATSSTTTAPSPSSPSTPAASQPKALAFTGMNVGKALLAALALLAVGLGVRRAGRAGGHA